MSGSPPDAPDGASSVDLSDEDVHWDLGSSLSYGEYLRLDRLLDAQKPLSTEHDEMLFIIVHQVSELWMRLMLHELTAVIECVRRDDLDPSFKLFDRIGRVQGQLLAVWDVLSTMTPADYSAFRNLLGRSSGFQSPQYRLLEFMLGNKNPEIIEVHRRDPAAYAALLRALAAPSLYDEVLRLLSQRGYGVPANSLRGTRHPSPPRQIWRSPDRGTARCALRRSSRRSSTLTTRCRLRLFSSATWSCVGGSNFRSWCSRAWACGPIRVRYCRCCSGSCRRQSNAPRAAHCW